MSRQRSPGRRRFFKLCASVATLAGLSPALRAGPDAVLKRYERVRLVDERDRPIAPKSLEVGEDYVFHYPYISTPCFLLDLGRTANAGTQLKTESGQSYEWKGGVGPKRSVVAFSAICAHKMSHPAKAVSFINYRHEPVRYKDSGERTAHRAQVIYCCSEKSVYDPVQGARVLGGPATQPLAAIALEHDPAEDALYAVGTYGGEMFDKFFREFGFRLALELETTDIRKPVREKAQVVPLARYCQTQVLC